METENWFLLATAEASLDARPTEPMHALHDGPCFLENTEADGALCVEEGEGGGGGRGQLVG